MRSRRRSSRDSEAEFRRADSVFPEYPVRRQLYTWRGVDEPVVTRRSLPPPFVKSVDYEPGMEAATLYAADESPGEFVTVPTAPVIRSGGGGVSYGPQGVSVRSLLRPYFTGSDTPCASRKSRREVIFAIGAGGRRLGTKRVRRTPDSERSC